MADSEEDAVDDMLVLWDATAVTDPLVLSEATVVILGLDEAVDDMLVL